MLISLSGAGYRTAQLHRSLRVHARWPGGRIRSPEPVSWFRSHAASLTLRYGSDGRGRCVDVRPTVSDGSVVCMVCQRARLVKRVRTSASRSAASCGVARAVITKTTNGSNPGAVHHQTVRLCYALRSRNRRSLWHMPRSTLETVAPSAPASWTREQCGGVTDSCACSCPSMQALRPCALIGASICTQACSVPDVPRSSKGGTSVFDVFDVPLVLPGARLPVCAAMHHAMQSRRSLHTAPAYS